MAKEVKVSIIVDDNGSMRLTERSAKKLGAGLDKVGRSAQTTDRQLKGVAQASSNGSKNFAKQAQGISGVSWRCCARMRDSESLWRAG